MIDFGHVLIVCLTDFVWGNGKQGTHTPFTQHPSSSRRVPVNLSHKYQVLQAEETDSDTIGGNDETGE